MNIKKTIAVSLIAICCTLSSYGCNGYESSKAAYYGKWRNGNTQIEVTRDTIYIDEIGVEGFGYSYDYDPKNDRFYLHDLFGDSDIVLEFRKKRKSAVSITTYYYGSNDRETSVFRKVAKNVDKLNR